MGAKTIISSIAVLALMSSINAIVVSPGVPITEGNCSGGLDYFLCNCMASNPTIDIHLSRGRYYFTNQSFCLLQNKIKIKLIGSVSNDTTIECKEFNIVFMGVQNVIIINITMINCGNEVHDSINHTVNSIRNSGAHLGSEFRFAMMFYHVKDITISNVTMQNTLGYGIVAFNAIGNITISRFSTENTTFKNDSKCDTYVYNNATADYICSGSGIFMIYYDNENEITQTNTTLIIDHSKFIGNKNFLPYNEFGVLNNAVNTNFHQASIPLQGAAGIAIFYLQDLYDVYTTITNSLFQYNNGTLSASIAIGSLSTIRGKTLIQNCLFDDNNRINKPHDITAINSIGGISYYYLTLNDIPKGSVITDREVEIVAVVQCNFTRLGGTLGAAFHIEKVSSNSQPLIFRIEECNFIGNEANVGSAVYAVDHRFDTALSNGLIINLVNVHATNNSLLSGSTIQHGSGDIITGVFHSEGCHFKFNCNLQCNFLNNQPSVFYGHSANLTISGKALFVNNTARRGGALSLINTVAFIAQNSELYFDKNHATTHGGAIYISLFNTYIEAQDVCPIQFIGSSNDTVFSLKDINQVGVNVTFGENTAIIKSVLQSIYANVFYLCTWYPNTLIQMKSIPVINGTRRSVYREMFHFIPNDTNKHLSILAIVPCPCDDDNTYDADDCLTADSLKLNFNITVGRTFTINLITLDVVGSVGYSSHLYSEVSSVNTTGNVLTLSEEQFSRSFSVINNKCTPLEFTIYALQSMIPESGILHLSLSPNSGHHFHFSFDKCPIGFTLQNINGSFACKCGEIFNESPIKEDFQCNPASGKVERKNPQSWLSVIDNKVGYTKQCLSGYCNSNIRKFSLTDGDALCSHNHTGEACRRCVDGYGKVFGTTVCEKCNYLNLLTTFFYCALGITLVLIIYLLKLTVTMGTINGLIFFCNVMSINESLFFNTAKSSFVRMFISLINLDLGFKLCFYKGMTQAAKTGLQFVFPVYLWLLMFIIIMVGKRYRSRRPVRSALPVLATLIFLSYSKILRTTISVFSSVSVYISENGSNFSELKRIVAWQPDPSVEYLKDEHILLFLVAMVFTVLFILPLAFALTFPKVVLRSKKLSRIFPLLDSIYAPYKDKYRYWFGVRIIVLIYLSGMESVLFSYQHSLLLSAVLAVLLFTIIQAYIRPFKKSINNSLDLMFMGIFIILGIVILYLHPDTLRNKDHIAVKILGGVAFFLFCVIILFHLHDVLMHLTWYSNFTKALRIKFNMKIVKSDWNPWHTVALKDVREKPINNDIDTKYSNYAYFQESLLEEQFN